MYDDDDDDDEKQLKIVNNIAKKTVALVNLLNIHA
jgi:hypothetical protein